MTLCIAAACRYLNRDAVVLGSDFMLTGQSKSDVHDKLYWINDKEWPVLISGDDVSRAIELKEVYRQTLESQAGILGANDLLRLMYEPLRTQKERISDQYVSKRLGISYEHLLTRGRDELPETTRAGMLAAIKRLRFKADLIIVVFVQEKTKAGRRRKYRRPLIFKVGDVGVDWCEQFACIGSGESIADSILSYRNHDESTPAYRGMFHVYEAMTMGSEVAPGVGQGAFAIVYDDGQDIVAIQPKGRYRTRLKKIFARRIGPRQVDGLPDLRPSDFTKF